MAQHRVLGFVAAALVASVTGCSGCASYRRCGVPAAAQLGTLPTRLSETGLFASGQLEHLGSGVREYAPAFALWSDGATKRRWVALPAGARIGSEDMDDWSFPVGSRFWKEFSLGGRRIETRLLMKVGPAPRDWAGAAYVWDEDQSDAQLAPAGLKDVAGSGYDVPSAADCQGCHGGRNSHVLGFSALQLARPDLPLPLDELVSEGWLTHAPDHPIELPDDGTSRALGYLHANCGHCHNRQRPPRGDGPRCYDPERSIDFWLSSRTAPDMRQQPAVATTVPRFVTPGEPDDSRLLTLVSRRGARLHMPPLGTQRVDEEGVRALREWILGLRPEMTSERPATP